MAKSLSSSLPTTLSLLLLALFLGLATSARLLDEFDPTIDLPALPPIVGPDTALPSSGQSPATAEDAAPAATDAPAPDEDDQPQPNPAAATPVTGPASGSAATGPAQGVAAAGVTAGGPEHPSLSFYMHDVLGGSHASGRIVTGIVATTDVNGIPFSRPNNQVFPVTNGVPLVNSNNLINNNNAPYLASMNGYNNNNNNVLQNAGTNSVVNNNNNNNNQAFVTPGQLPSGTALQKLMFGSITVIDDELTEGHELGSAVIGKGQGFYLASSLNGDSHTMAFTACLEGGEHEHEDDNTISFFGVHRTASPISQLSIIGGTGKYENASGYATIETLPQEDQHTTDGVDTIAHINVFLY